MIEIGTKVNICDNSGALIGKCIRILKPSSYKGRRAGKIGSVILITVLKTNIKNLTRNKNEKNLNLNLDIKKGDLLKALIVRTTRWSGDKSRKPFLNKFDTNQVVIVKYTKKEGLTPISSRIQSPICYSLRVSTDKGIKKILSSLNN